MIPAWSTSCPDWESRIINRQSLLPCAPLFPGEAKAALDIFSALKIVDVAGMPTFGEISRPWEFDLPKAVFGAYDPESGKRLINEFFLLISKKNDKSTLAAGIMLTALLLNWRQNGEFIIIAPTIEVANNSAKPAIAMVQQDPELLELLKPIPHLRTIEHRATGATLKIVAADSETVSGKKAIGVLIEELWLFGKMAHAENMLLEATGGLAARPEGFVIALSTQSDEPPAGVFKQWLDRFRDIRDGKLIALRSLGLLYEFPKAMLESRAFENSENWYITNPNLGASVQPDFLQDQFEKAKAKGASSLAGFFAKHLNVEIGINLRANRWPGADFWQRRADASITFESILKRCEVCIVALDGGGLDDLYGFNLLGREKIETEIETEEVDEKTGERIKVTKREKRWLSWSHAWCHETVLDRRKSIASLLRDLEKAGELTIVGDELGDIEAMIALIVKVKEAGLLHCVAVDPAGIGDMIDALAEIDVTQENKARGANFVIGVPQGYAMMNALKTGERRLARGTLIHADQKLMDWAIGNVKIEPTATAIRATKQNAGDAKVDPAFALFDAITVMSTNPANTRSVYEDRPLLVL